MVLTPQQTADQVRLHMWAQDQASQALGMQILAMAPGTATLSMPVRQDMLNGHHTCHGGLLSTLADSAFAFACNSYNELTVASGFSIDLVAPAREGDRLTATAVDISKAGRTGVYDIDVRNQRSERIAVLLVIPVGIGVPVSTAHLVDQRGADLVAFNGE